jgi:predicted site-specific integrase-resolvase
LVERSEACRLLSISVATALRLERVGRLKPIKLFPSPNGRTFYSYDHLRALAAGEQAEAVVTP